MKRHTATARAVGGTCFVLLVTGWAVCAVGADAPARLRIATYNCSLSPDIAAGPGSLAERLRAPNDRQAELVAEIIQRVNPDVLLLNEFNWDPAGEALERFVTNYLGRGHDACTTGTPSVPISFPYRYLPVGGTSPFNTGIPSGHDLDNDGSTTGPSDALGFGQFAGQYGMVLLSKYPLDAGGVRTFQRFLWKDMPGNLIPRPFYSDQEAGILRLSSKSHWDVPIDVAGRTIHILASHPTPPVFDGAEDRNGRRNHDEIRFWVDYVTPGKGTYIYDDAQFRRSGNATPAAPAGGLPAGESFVIIGDQNADPLDGHGYPGAADQLLGSPRIDASIVPASEGGPEAALLQPAANSAQAGNPVYDTSAFGSSGNLRTDYVLPSAGLMVLGGAVYWPPTSAPLFGLVTHGQFPSDHRLVYIDVALPLDRGRVSTSETMRPGLLRGRPDVPPTRPAVRAAGRLSGRR